MAEHVHVVVCPLRFDGVYVFAGYDDAHRFLRAVGDPAAYYVEEVVIEQADELIAAEADG